MKESDNLIAHELEKRVMEDCFRILIETDSLDELFKDFPHEEIVFSIFNMNRYFESIEYFEECSILRNRYPEYL